MHIFPPIMSTRSLGMKFTAQGLGDRFHLVSLAYQISRMENTLTTLHLAKNHSHDHKFDSFNEICRLFPSGYILLEFHPFEFGENQSWIDYLRSKHSEAKLIGYKDHTGWLETNFDFDASLRLKSRFLISPTCAHFLNLPEKYVAYQWDSTGIDRQLEESKIVEIEEAYFNLGYEKIVVGGKSQIATLRNCLACASKAIYMANFFVGVDSGFMHVALQVLPPSRIHLYTSVNRFWSHHLFRALDSGVQINFFGRPIGFLQLTFLRLRYDSPRVRKIIHSLKILR